jgi:integrase
MRIELRGINTVHKTLSDGTRKTYYYHRDTGTRLEGEPGSAEFVASSRAAGEARAKARNAGTVSWLIKQFCASKEWRKLADSTKEIGRINLNAVDAKWGKTPLKIAENKRSRPVFLKWHDKLAETHPRAADAKLAALARVLSWGVDRGLIDHNPVKTFSRAYSSDRSEQIWLPEHIEAFGKVASPELMDALALALHTGQRQGDLLRLTWRAFDGTAISLGQGKTRRSVYIPCTDALLEKLGRIERRSTQILTRADGSPWTRDAFKQAWREAYAASELEDDLHFHDLRGTAVTMLAEAGCSVPEIAAITGHSPAHAQKILDKYLARIKALAKSAIAKLNEHRRNRA